MYRVKSCLLESSSLLEEPLSSLSQRTGKGEILNSVRHDHLILALEDGIFRMQDSLTRCEHQIVALMNSIDIIFFQHFAESHSGPRLQWHNTVFTVFENSGMESSKMEKVFGLSNVSLIRDGGQKSCGNVSIR